MACQGPNLEGTKNFGKKVAEALLDELIKQYKLTKPTNNKNVDKQWKKATNAFVKSVQDIFVESACNSF